MKWVFENRGNIDCFFASKIKSRKLAIHITLTFMSVIIRIDLNLNRVWEVFTKPLITPLSPTLQGNSCWNHHDVIMFSFLLLKVPTDEYGFFRSGYRSLLIRRSVSLPSLVGQADGGAYCSWWERGSGGHVTLWSWKLNRRGSWITAGQCHRGFCLRRRLLEILPPYILNKRVRVQF